MNQQEAHLPLPDEEEYWKSKGILSPSKIIAFASIIQALEKIHQPPACGSSKRLPGDAASTKVEG